MERARRVSRQLVQVSRRPPIAALLRVSASPGLRVSASPRLCASLLLPKLTPPRPHSRHRPDTTRRSFDTFARISRILHPARWRPPGRGSPVFLARRPTEPIPLPAQFRHIRAHFPHSPVPTPGPRLPSRRRIPRSQRDHFERAFDTFARTSRIFGATSRRPPPLPRPREQRRLPRQPRPRHFADRARHCPARLPHPRPFRILPALRHHSGEQSRPPGRHPQGNAREPSCPRPFPPFHGPGSRPHGAPPLSPAPVAVRPDGPRLPGR